MRCQQRKWHTLLLDKGCLTDLLLRNQAKVTHKIGVQHCGYLAFILLKWLFIQ